jgi:predicted double-glycine peptidase
MLEQRHDKLVLQKWDFSCGAAALATLLQYQHGDPIDEKSITEWMLRNGDAELVMNRQGFSMLDLKRFLRTRGYEGVGFGEMKLADLVETAPAIIPLHANDYDHFVVFRGVQEGRVLVADPAYGNRLMSVDAFEEEWVSKTAFLVQRPGSSTRPGRLVASADDFVTPPAEAIRRAIR